MEDVIVSLVAAVIGGMAGGYASRYVRLPVDNIMAPEAPKPEHPHSFDTMLGDGLGWRCGMCGELRGE